MVTYAATYGIITCYAIKNGLSVALFPGVLFGRTGTILATLSTVDIRQRSELNGQTQLVPAALLSDRPGSAGGEDRQRLLDLFALSLRVRLKGRDDWCQ